MITNNHNGGTEWNKNKLTELTLHVVHSEQPEAETTEEGDGYLTEKYLAKNGSSNLHEELENYQKELKGYDEQIQQKID